MLRTGVVEGDTCGCSHGRSVARSEDGEIPPTRHRLQSPASRSRQPGACELAKRSQAGDVTGHDPAAAADDCGAGIKP